MIVSEVMPSPDCHDDPTNQHETRFLSSRHGCQNPEAPAVKREAEEDWGKDKKPRQADGAKVTPQRRPSGLKAKGSPISL
jgi:hypothetical protein